jgi:hypothetical protein
MFNIVFSTNEECQIFTVHTLEVARRVAIAKILNWGTDESFDYGFFPKGDEIAKEFLYFIWAGEFEQAICFFNYHSDGSKLLIQEINFETEIASHQDLKDTAETELCQK